MAPFVGDPSMSVLPPPEQWREILTDLRTKQQRELAFWNHDGHIWLRTCYTTGSDEIHSRLLRDFDPGEALNSEDTVLDDATLYSYGDDWAKIFSVLPEIILQIKDFSESDYWKDSSDSVRRYLDDEKYFIEQLKECIASQPSTRDEMSAAFHEQNEDAFQDEGEESFGWALRSLHLASTHSWCVVADEEAIQTGLVLLVFFDDKGRVVRQGRRTPSDCTYMEGAFVDGCIDEDETMNFGEPGPAYAVGGVCGPPFEHCEADLTLPEPRSSVTDASQRPSTPELGPAYLTDRQRVLDRLKSGVR
jgi:hypothetical protein